MKRATLFSCLFLVFVLVILSACGSGAQGTPTSDADLVYTQIWQTVEAGKTQTAAVIPPTAEFTSTPEITSTPEPTNTPLISPTSATPGTAVPPQSTNTLVRPTSQASCDKMTFVDDVTYPDGTEVPAGTTIEKTWRFKNTGTCKWTTDYKLIFGYGGNGTNWSRNPAVNFHEEVGINESIDITIELDVPDEPGAYVGWFRLQNDKGFNFGDFFWVSINAK
jgi:hypothetical protein